jgi:hypothetical protein
MLRASRAPIAGKAQFCSGAKQVTMLAANAAETSAPINAA